ncbi:MAG: acyltransferase family protein, partial [Pseudomonadota bacterium]|nr:acyltransferase family protein [Pseudomonadota bacterium]
MSNISYRPDIDGLRALAIIPVLLFHVGIAGFGGGFVGVDVFLVISGYLITSIIAREVEAGEFTFSNFWARRARRILPASILMMIGCLVAGWFILAPDDYFDLGRSAREQAYFAGNFYFWKESGYFDGPSELKPLLHTWSLAVEEQFYFVFPLLFILAHRFFANHKLSFFVLVFIASFVASVMLVDDYPSSTFYLLHTRAWELLVGGLIAIAPARQGVKAGTSELISLIGLAMIVYAIARYDHSTTFPGATALLPTLGTGAIIWANTYHKTMVSKLLSLKVFVTIGLISYSLYLYHWPLIAFTRYQAVGGELDTVHQAFLIVGSFVLAYLSWKFVETPFRKKSLFPTNKKILTASLSVLVVVAVAGQMIRKTEGYPERLPPHVLAYAEASSWAKYQKRCYKLTPEDIKNGEICRFGEGQDGSTTLLFWGDSHAAAYLPAVRAKAEEHSVLTLHASDSACPPIAGAERPNDEECVKFNAIMLEQID